MLSHISSIHLYSGGTRKKLLFIKRQASKRAASTTPSNFLFFLSRSSVRFLFLISTVCGMIIGSHNDQGCTISFLACNNSCRVNFFAFFSYVTRRMRFISPQPFQTDVPRIARYLNPCLLLGFSFSSSAMSFPPQPIIDPFKNVYNLFKGRYMRSKLNPLYCLSYSPLPRYR